jgi:trehalose 6-phosphate synthase/phosphatase
VTPLREHPSQARLSPGMRKVLEACLARDDTEVTLMSGRSLEDVRGLLDHPRLGYAANHGLEIVGPGLPDFCHEDLPHFAPRTRKLAQRLSQLAVEGAWVEEKGLSLAYHHRQVSEESRPSLLEEARALVREEGFQAFDGPLALEARPPIGWDKGRAVLYVLRKRHSPSWTERVRVIYVGDDGTDEDAFRVLSGLAISFRVGGAETPSSASRRLANVEAVQALLDWVATRPAPELEPG